MLGRSRALNYIKHRKVINFVELTEADNISAEQETLEEIILADERKRIVNNALNSLTEDMRVVVHLIYFEDLSYDEAAKVMKKNRKQVDNLLYRAKNLPPGDVSCRIRTSCRLLFVKAYALRSRLLQNSEAGKTGIRYTNLCEAHLEKR